MKKIVFTLITALLLVSCSSQQYNGDRAIASSKKFDDVFIVEPVSNVKLPDLKKPLICKSDWAQNLVVTYYPLYSSTGRAFNPEYTNDNGKPFSVVYHGKFTNSGILSFYRFAVSSYSSAYNDENFDINKLNVSSLVPLMAPRKITPSSKFSFVTDVFSGGEFFGAGKYDITVEFLDTETISIAYKSPTGTAWERAKCKQAQIREAVFPNK